MPDKQAIKRARADKRAGKSASTQAGEFVRREIDQIRAGKHGAKNAKQAIAIGLSEARRAGVAVGENPNRKSSGKTKARKATRKSTRKAAATSRTRAKAALKVLKKLPRRAASHLALSRQAHSTARTRTKAQRSASARKAARTRAANRGGR